MLKNKLKNIAALINGYAFKSENYTDDGIRVIRIANVQDGYLSDESPCFYPYEFQNKINKAMLEEDDLLMSLTGNVGRVAILKKEFLPAGLNQRVECIRPQKTSDREYLYYYFRSPTFKNKVTAATTGCAQQNLSIKWLENHEVPYYETEKQQYIVKNLKHFDELINLKKEQLKQLDELVKSRFIEMFGDVKNNDKNFFVKKGTDLFKFSSGKFLEATKRLESGIPVYGGNGIAWYTSEPLINFDTIVIGRVGAYCGNVRKISGSNWITDNAIYIKEFKEKCFNLEFLEALMGEYDFAQFNDAAAQPKITQKPMENLYYIVPPIELQNTFAEFVKQVDKSKFIVQKQIDDLQELLDSKMDEYFG